MSWLLQTVLVLTAAGGLKAHFALVEPRSALRIEDGGKGEPPCAEGPPSNVVTSVRGGRPLAIRLSEFVFHPGHYRIALSVNSRTELPPDPDVRVDSNGNSVSAVIQNPPRVPVLADGLFAHTTPPSGDWQTSITLPNLNCEKCTLQIIEFMAEHGPNFGGGYYYHHCADLRITADPDLPPADAAWPRSAGAVTAAIPFAAAGAGWTTTLVIGNGSTAAVPVSAAFRADDGTEVSLPVTGTAAPVVPNGMMRLATGDPPSGVFRGWAEVRSSDPVSGFAILRYAPGAGPPAEVTIPLQAQSSAPLTLPFDNAGGLVTNIVVANPSVNAVNATVTAYDDAGRSLGVKSVAIAAGGRVELALPDQIPAAAGQRGSVRVEGAPGLAGVALRFDGAGGMMVLPRL